MNAAHWGRDDDDLDGVLGALAANGSALSLLDQRPGAPAPTPTVPLPTATRRPPLKNVTRERMRAEIAALRTEVQRLEELRAALLHGRGGDGPSLSSSAGSHSWPGAPWSSAAAPLPMSTATNPDLARERHLRAAAEAENARLKREIDRQLALTQDLCRRAEADVGLHALLLTPTTPPSTPPSPVPSIDDIGDLLRRFSQEIDHAYVHFDYSTMAWPEPVALGEVRSGCAVRSRPVPDPTAAMDPSAPVTERFFEYQEHRLVPYDFERTHTAFWSSMDVAHNQIYPHREVFLSDQDQYAFRYVLPDRFTTFSEYVTTTIFFRRFVEAERVVIVWRAIDTLTDARGTALHDTYMDETGWIVDRRVRHGPGVEEVRHSMCAHLVACSSGGISTASSPDGESPIATTAARVSSPLSPSASSSGGGRRPAVESAQLASMVLQLINDDTAETIEAMENLLIDECLS